MTHQEMTPEQLTEYTYIGFVGSLAKPGQDILSSLTPEKCHLLHMAIGAEGEVNELINNTGLDNIIEECGDLEFFLTGMYINTTEFGVGWNSNRILSHHVLPLYNSQDVLEHAYSMSDKTNEMLDLIMKHAIRNKPLDTVKISEILRRLQYDLATIYKYLNVTRAEVLEANKKKLDKRYKDGYSDKAAQERADKIDGE